TTSPSTQRQIVYRYDALGRLTHSEDQTDGEVDPRTVKDFLYDQPVTNAVPAVTPTNVLGRLAMAISPLSSTSFSYDLLGRVNAQVYSDLTQMGNNAFVEKRAYHGDGSLSGFDLLLPDSGYTKEHVDYVYDSAGRLQTLTYSDGIANRSLFAATGSGAI